MKLPELHDPNRYQGLYIFDFQGQVGVGYTAGEIEILLESEKYRNGKVYKIHRALPDGRLEIKGVPNKVFEMESGIFFHCSDLEQARRDYQALLELGENSRVPCRAKLHLARSEFDSSAGYVVALIYPAEYEEQIGQWLLQAGYKGGQTVSGGSSEVQNYYRRCTRLESHQLWGVLDGTSRSAEEVLANVGKAVVR